VRKGRRALAASGAALMGLPQRSVIIEFGKILKRHCHINVMVNIFQKIKICCFVVFLATGCWHCSEETFNKIKGQFGGMFEIKKIVDARIRGGECGINIHNSEILTISLVNTLSNDGSKEERKYVADDIAYAVNAYISRKVGFENVRTLTIGFVKYKKYTIVEYKETIGHYRYDVASLREGMSPKLTTSSGNPNFLKET